MPELPDILARILRDRKTRVAEAQARISEETLRRRAEALPRRDFCAALTGAHPRPAVIAEMKRASPSSGRLRADLDPAALAQAYERGGAAALSVLTEPDWFLGELNDLEQARAACGLPILRKDFLFCGYQVWEAAAAGADAVLLIAALLDDRRLADLLAVADQAGLAALCEVHDGAELARVKALGAACIGVNNRDLHTFAVDGNRARDLAPHLPAGSVRVAESGYRDAAGLIEAAAAGYDAVLIGECLVRAGDPGAELAALRRGLVS